MFPSCVAEIEDRMKDRSHLPCTDPEEVKKARDDLDSMKVGSESGPYKG